jgi:opacity protein-like surface antigen
LKNRLGIRLLVGFALGVATAGSAAAQASLTADRSADVNVFFGGSRVSPDFGKAQSGYAFGADYTRFFKHLYAAPSLELRATISPTGRSVSEHTYSGGLKLEHEYFRRYHAYADLFGGVGYISYVPYVIAPGGVVETHDSSFVVTYGGGVDIDLYRRFALKLDYQGSHWNTLDIGTLSPKSLTIGVVYHLPQSFRRHD